jgi:ubiquinone/menaquinone biosynthesis C-methylase UbiE
MSDPVSRTRDTYDAIGAEFLEKTRDRSDIRKWLDGFASLLPAGSLVIDVGGGPGFDAAELRGRGLEAICVDLSLGMLRSGIREFPAPRVQADLRCLPFPSRSVCGAWVNASLLHLSKPEAGSALREIHRVLRAPGFLHVSVKRGRGSEWESGSYGKPRWFQYWSGAELDAVLEASGFSVEAAWVNETARATWLVRLASMDCVV